MGAKQGISVDGSLGLTGINGEGSIKTEHRNYANTVEIGNQKRSNKCYKWEMLRIGIPNGPKKEWISR